MTQDPASAVTDTELQRALAELEASRERVYYDADADAVARDSYYASLDQNAAPGESFSALASLLDRTHAPRPSYKPAERVSVGGSAS